MMNRKGLLWPVIMYACVLTVALVIVGSYYYFGFFSTRLSERISSPVFDPEQPIFLPLLLTKKVGTGNLADAITELYDASQPGSTVNVPSATVQREINEMLYTRFGGSVEWNLYVEGREIADNQLTGFIGGRRFRAYIPYEKNPGILLVELEVNDDAWEGEIGEAYFGKPGVSP